MAGISWGNFPSPLKTPPVIGIPMGLMKTRQQKLVQSREMYGANAAYTGSQNAIQGYQESSDINRAKMNQSLAARGIGNSSIATQNKQTFENQYSRNMQTLQDRNEMNRRQLTIMRRQRVMNRRIGPLAFFDGLINQAAQMGEQLMGGGGGGGAEGATPGNEMGGYDQPNPNFNSPTPNFGDAGGGGYA